LEKGRITRDLIPSGRARRYFSPLSFKKKSLKTNPLAMGNQYCTFGQKLMKSKNKELVAPKGGWNGLNFKRKLDLIGRNIGSTKTNIHTDSKLKWQA